MTTGCLPMQTPRFLYPTRRGKRMGRQENRQGPHPPQKPKPNLPPISAAQTPPETRRIRRVSPRSDNGTGCPITSAGPSSTRRHRIPAPHFFASRSALRRTRRRSAAPEDPPHRSLLRIPERSCACRPRRQARTRKSDAPEITSPRSIFCPATAAPSLRTQAVVHSPSRFSEANAGPRMLPENEDAPLSQQKKNLFYQAAK